MNTDTPDTPVEPQTGEDQFIDPDGNVQTDNIDDKTLQNTRYGENPFTGH